MAFKFFTIVFLCHTVHALAIPAAPPNSENENREAYDLLSLMMQAFQNTAATPPVQYAVQPELVMPVNFRPRSVQDVDLRTVVNAPSRGCAAGQARDWAGRCRSTY